MNDLNQQLASDTTLSLHAIESILADSINETHFIEGISKLCKCNVDKDLANKIWLNRPDSIS